MIGPISLRRIVMVWVLVLGLLLAPGWVVQARTSPYLSPEITLLTLDNTQLLPAVAFNRQRQEYLVVWQNKWAGNRDIYAQRVTVDGRVLSWFAVTSGPTDRAQPSVAYDPVNNRYLVVWIEDVLGNGSDWDIRGRFIPALGPDPTLTDFVICNWTSSQWNPVVAYAEAQNEYMVVWANQQAVGVPWYVSGRRMDATSGAFFSVGSDISLAHATNDRVNPAIAYNLARNEYLIVWQEVGSGQDIWAQRITASAVPLGGPFGIAGWPDQEIQPAVAACSAADQYLVGWQSNVNPAQGNYDIYAWFLNGDATFIGGPQIIDDTTLPEENVAIACTIGGDAYLLTWQARYTNLHYGIAARLAHTDTQLERAFNLAAPLGNQDRTSPAVAAGRGSYLVAWEHTREGTTYQDIHARIWYDQLLYIPCVMK